MLKGSFTIEAAFVVPFILLTISGSIQMGYQMYQEEKEAVVIQKDIQKLDVVKIVRRNQLLQEFR